MLPVCAIKYTVTDTSGNSKVKQVSLEGEYAMACNLDKEQVNVEKGLPRCFTQARRDVSHFKNGRLATLLAKESQCVPVVDGKRLFCNIVSPAGGAWYIPPEAIYGYWQECVDMLLNGRPLFVSETHSKNSPDSRLSFFLDLDSPGGLHRELLAMLFTDIVHLVTDIILHFDQAHIAPSAQHALVIAVHESTSKFGCHVVVNTLLADRQQRDAMTALACQLWSNYGWQGMVEIDRAACTGLRPILSNKIGKYPIKGQFLVDIDQGRTYDIACTYHMTDSGFTLAGEKESVCLYSRPGLTSRPPPLFSVDSIEQDSRTGRITACKVGIW